MKLGIYSPKQTLYDGNAKSINCQTTAGEITILDQHRPLVSVLKEGVIKIVDEAAKDHYVNAKSGFLEVKADGEVRFIIEE